METKALALQGKTDSSEEIAERSNLVRVNLLVPAKVRKEWKATALAADKTLTDLIIEAMQELLAQKNNADKNT